MMAYLPTSYMEKPMMYDYDRDENSTLRYLEDLNRWKQHCTEMRDRNWHNQCEYKSRHWKNCRTKSIKRKVKKVNRMAVDFSAFDQKVNLDALQKEVAEAKENEFEDVPDGTYIVGIEKMEIKPTKTGDKLMFAAQCKIKEGEYKNRMIFFNRVISGNKNSETWNDGKAIKSVITWLDKLETETLPEFVNYGDFADCVLDIFQEIQGKVEMEIDYTSKGFNPISIKEVFDC